jgi:hypothetical protein
LPARAQLALVKFCQLLRIDVRLGLEQLAAVPVAVAIVPSPPLNTSRRRAKGHPR